MSLNKYGTEDNSSRMSMSHSPNYKNPTFTTSFTRKVKQNNSNLSKTLAKTRIQYGKLINEHSTALNIIMKMEMQRNTDYQFYQNVLGELLQEIRKGKSDVQERLTSVEGLIADTMTRKPRDILQFPGLKRRNISRTARKRRTLSRPADATLSHADVALPLPELSQRSSPTLTRILAGLMNQHSALLNSESTDSRPTEETQCNADNDLSPELNKNGGLTLSPINADLMNQCDGMWTNICNKTSLDIQDMEETIVKKSPIIVCKYPEIPKIKPACVKWCEDKNSGPLLAKGQSEETTCSKLPVAVTSPISDHSGSSIPVSTINMLTSKPLSLRRPIDLSCVLSIDAKGKQDSTCFGAKRSDPLEGPSSGPLSSSSSDKENACNKTSLNIQETEETNVKNGLFLFRKFPGTPDRHKARIQIKPAGLKLSEDKKSGPILASKPSNETTLSKLPVAPTTRVCDIPGPSVDVTLKKVSKSEPISSQRTVFSTAPSLDLPLQSPASVYVRPKRSTSDNIKNYKEVPLNVKLRRVEIGGLMVVDMNSPCRPQPIKQNLP